MKYITTVDKDTNWEELFATHGLENCFDDFSEFWSTYRTLPDKEKFPYYRDGYIIDENQTVVWNREQVAASQEAYKEETCRLRKEIKELRVAFDNALCSQLAKDYNISVEEASILWACAWEKEHTYGYRDAYYFFDTLADMYKDLLKVRGK